MECVTIPPDVQQTANEHQQAFDNAEKFYGQVAGAFILTAVVAAILRKLSFGVPAVIGGGLGTSCFLIERVKLPKKMRTQDIQRERWNLECLICCPELNWDKGVQQAVKSWPQLLCTINANSIRKPDEILGGAYRRAIGFSVGAWATWALTGVGMIAAIYLTCASAAHSFRNARLAASCFNIPPRPHWSGWQSARSATISGLGQLGWAAYSLVWGPRTRAGDFLLGAAAATMASLLIALPMQAALNNRRRRNEDLMRVLVFCSKSKTNQIPLDPSVVGKAAAWLDRFGSRIPSDWNIDARMGWATKTKELNISRSSTLNDETLKTALRQRPHLEKVVLTDCSCITGSFLEALPLGVKELQIDRLSKVPEHMSAMQFTAINIRCISQPAAKQLGPRLQAHHLAISLQKPDGSKWEIGQLQSLFPAQNYEKKTWYFEENQPKSRTEQLLSPTQQGQNKPGIDTFTIVVFKEKDVRFN